MAFAYFMQHFPRGFWPIRNGGEVVVLYCFLFLYIAANGAGMWGVWRRPLPPTTPAERTASTIRD
jgi:putative oxidoreductase